MFTEDEVQTMHHWCLQYRELVRSGGMPTREECERFVKYQAVTYERGVARGKR